MKKKVRKNPIIFPMGLRVGATEGALIIDFLDQEYECEIISSYALPKDMALNLLENLKEYISQDD